MRRDVCQIDLCRAQPEQIIQGDISVRTLQIRGDLGLQPASVAHRMLCQAPRERPLPGVQCCQAGCCQRVGQAAPAAQAAQRAENHRTTAGRLGRRLLATPALSHRQSVARAAIDPAPRRRRACAGRPETAAR